MSDIYAAPLISEQADSHVDIADLVDGAGNRFIAVLSAGNANYVTVYRFTPEGNQSVLGTVYAGPSNHKIDKISMSHSGANLLLALATHEAVSTKPRSVRIESAVIAGVYTYRAGMESEEGGAGAFSGSGTGEPGSGGTAEVDYTKIREIVASEVSAAQTKIIDNIRPKVVAGLARALNKGLYASDGDVRAYQDALFKRSGDDLFLILNKLITGQDPNHPIQNGPFKALIKSLVLEALDEHEHGSEASNQS